MSTYSLITAPYRYVEKVTPATKTAYQLARSITLEGQLSSLTDADSVANALYALINGPRQRFEVTVLGVDVVTLDMFDGGCPCASLVWDRFSLSAGKLVVIPDFTIDLRSQTTVLRCWG